MKLMRSFLTEPGELKYGARRAPSGVAYRMRIYFVMVALRSAVLASFCFFLDRAAFDTKGFVVFKGLATPYIWGVGLAVVVGLMVVAVLVTKGCVARAGLIVSGWIMLTAGLSFLASAIQYGAGWWAAVAYLSIGLFDFLVASYYGESV